MHPITSAAIKEIYRDRVYSILVSNKKTVYRLCTKSLANYALEKDPDLNPNKLAALCGINSAVVYGWYYSDIDLMRSCAMRK